MTVADKDGQMLQLGYELLFRLLCLQDFVSPMRFWGCDGALRLEVLHVTSIQGTEWTGRILAPTLEVASIKGSSWRAVLLRMMALFAETMAARPIEAPNLMLAEQQSRS